MGAGTRSFLTVEVPLNGVQPRRSMPNMKNPFKADYACKTCRARIAAKECILSWEYRGSKGKAALFTQANVALDERPSVLLMDSGVYRVRHSRCAACSAKIGWKFITASEKAERWKEGYFVLELTLLQEERAPLSPLEEVQREHEDDYGYGSGPYRGCRLSVMGMPTVSGGGHWRSASVPSTASSSPSSSGSETSPRPRARPLGPRRIASSGEQ